VSVPITIAPGRNLSSISDTTVPASPFAQRVDITERAAQHIVAELEAAGYLSHEKVGRRNRYQVNPALPLRHSLEEHLEIGTLLNVLTERD